MITSPCKNCPNRKAFCHHECDFYKSFREDKDKENEKIRKDRQLYNALESTEVERSRKLKRRSRR